ncbi:MAG: HDOD domain-containing protein [Gammaproteobacteria bacterium]|nr:HDOD domain-containing protein [Gammaproteobacteria bacterium]
MDVSINQLEMPKASAYAAVALEIVNSDSPNFKQLENAIMHDPFLASTLIRYANSPLNRRAAEVTNVPTAIQLLGLKSVRSAVVTATIRSLLPADSDTGLAILNHMLDISTLCKLIARQCCPAVTDDLEFLGLVHDVGMLVLAANFQRSYDKLLVLSVSQHKSLTILEQEEFHITHDEVTGRAAEEFRLPRLHIELLENFHHRPSLQALNSEKERDIAILSLAHGLLTDIDKNKSPLITETVLESTSQLQQLLALSAGQIDQIITEAGELLSVSGV